MEFIYKNTKAAHREWAEEMVRVGRASGDVEVLARDYERSFLTMKKNLLEVPTSGIPMAPLTLEGRTVDRLVSATSGYYFQEGVLHILLPDGNTVKVIEDATSTSDLASLVPTIVPTRG